MDVHLASERAHLVGAPLDALDAGVIVRRLRVGHE
jgi:hypothetical protein